MKRADRGLLEQLFGIVLVQRETEGCRVQVVQVKADQLFECLPHESHLSSVERPAGGSPTPPHRVHLENPKNGEKVSVGGWWGAAAGWADKTVQRSASLQCPMFNVQYSMLKSARAAI